MTIITLIDWFMCFWFTRKCNNCMANVGHFSAGTGVGSTNSADQARSPRGSKKIPLFGVLGHNVGSLVEDHSGWRVGECHARSMIVKYPCCRFRKTKGRSPCEKQNFSPFLVFKQVKPKRSFEILKFETYPWYSLSFFIFSCKCVGFCKRMYTSLT